MIFNRTGALSNISNITNITGCRYMFGSDDILTARFLMIGVFLTIMCIIGIIGNVLVIIILPQLLMQKSAPDRKRKGKMVIERISVANTLFLVTLAIMDITVMTSTIMLYVVEVIYDYMQSFDLYYVWHQYVREAYVVSHVSQTCEVVLTVAATIERFVSERYSDRTHYRFCSSGMGILCIIVILACSIAFATTKFFEISLSVEDICLNRFGHFRIGLSDLGNDETYNLVHGVWLGQGVFVFAPFMILTILNFLIFREINKRSLHSHRALSVRRMKLTQVAAGKERPHMFEQTCSEQSSIVYGKSHDTASRRADTIVLIMVVLVFLLSNSLAVVITLMERIDHASIVAMGDWYSICRDIINLLAVINSSSNFFIYVIFHKEFKLHFKTWWSRKNWTIYGASDTVGRRWVTRCLVTMQVAKNPNDRNDLGADISSQNSLSPRHQHLKRDGRTNEETVDGTLDFGSSNRAFGCSLSSLTLSSIPYIDSPEYIDDEDRCRHNGVISGFYLPMLLEREVESPV